MSYFVNCGVGGISSVASFFASLSKQIFAILLFGVIEIQRSVTLSENYLG